MAPVAVSLTLPRLPSPPPPPRRRVKAGLRLLLNLNSWFKRICLWDSPQDSLEVVFCIALLCYLPSTACKVGMLWNERRAEQGREGGADGVGADWKDRIVTGRP